MRGLFLQREHPAVGSELHDAVARGIRDMVAEDRRAVPARAGAFERFHEVVAVEKIIAEHEGRGHGAQEAEIGRASCRERV